MSNLTRYQHEILEILSWGHGKMTTHNVSVLAGQGYLPGEMPLSTLRNLEEMGLVEQSLPENSNSRWKLTELGKQALALRKDSKPKDNSEDKRE